MRTIQQTKKIIMNNIRRKRKKTLINDKKKTHMKSFDYFFFPFYLNTSIIILQITKKKNC